MAGPEAGERAPVPPPADGKPARRGRTVVSVLAAVIAAVSIFGGLLAGVVNREIMDSPQFASHVNAVRQDAAVAEAVGDAVVDSLTRARPDLIAFQPLLKRAAAALVSSSAFDGVVQSTVRQLHANLVDGRRGFVVNLTDFGAVAAALIPQVAPEASEYVPPDLSVGLTKISAPSSGGEIISYLRWTRLLSWLLPLVGLALLALSLLTARDRWTGMRRAGTAIASAGAATLVAAAVTGIAAGRRDGASLNGTLAAAGWREVRRDFWTAGAVCTVLGAVLVGVGSVALSEQGRSRAVQAVTTLISDRQNPAAQAVRAALAIGLGLFVALNPGTALTVLAVAAGLLLLTVGTSSAITQIAAYDWAALRRGRPTRDGTAEAPAPARPPVAARAGLLPVTAVVVVVGLLALFGLQAAPTSDVQATIGSRACNGSTQLCDRPYDDVAFPAAHNAMSAADEPGWFFPEQPTGPVGALNAGVRVLLLDVWYGQSTERTGFVVTAGRSLDNAVAASRRELGSAATDSALRLRSALLPTPQGPVRPYLCHGLCETGATALGPQLELVRDWLQAHPREVVTLFLEDYITSDDTAQALTDAGLDPYLHVQRKGQPWPTLEQMIDSGRRLVVLLEKQEPGPQHPALLNGFDWVQDTSYTTPSVADLSCALNRGESGHPLLLLNVWLSGLTTAVTDAERVNAYDVLDPYVERCRRERGQIPNFVAVNFYDKGAVFAVVDRLNGVTP